MSSMPQSKRPYDLFYSYADEDIQLVRKLEDHLSVLRHEGEIRELHKRNISPGAEWQSELDKFMKQASIILLLISPGFLASDYLYNTELKQTIKRCEEHKAIIIPIILVSCDWKEVPFGIKKLVEYEVVPRNEKAVTSYHKRNDAFTEIAQAVRQAVMNLREYEQELNTGIVNLRPKSIYPRTHKAISQRILPLEDLPPNPLHVTGHHTIRSSNAHGINKTSNSSDSGRISPQSRNTGRRVKANTQQHAQFAGDSVVDPLWGKKPIKPSFFSQMSKKYFTFDDISNYDTGIRGGLFLFFFAFDVGGLTLVSRYWQISQEQPLFALVLSLLFFLWGVFNKNGLVALGLAASFSFVWIIIGFHYIPLYPVAIPVAMIAASFVLAFARFILFREYKHKKRLPASRSR